MTPAEFRSAAAPREFIVTRTRLAIGPPDLHGHRPPTGRVRLRVMLRITDHIQRLPTTDRDTRTPQRRRIPLREMQVEPHLHTIRPVRLHLEIVTRPRSNK